MTEEGADARMRAQHGRAQADVIATIALGGALGASARYGIARLVTGAPGSFPWATFWTNVSGSFVLGFILMLIVERFPPSRYLRPFAATGFLGAYTTYSTYAVETVLLGRAGHWGAAAAYALGSLVAGAVAAWSGILLARIFPIRDRFRKGARA